MLEIADEPELYSKVLYARYVNRNRLLPIALGLGRSYDRMRHVHLEALDHFAAHHEMTFFQLLFWSFLKILLILDSLFCNLYIFRLS